MPHDTPLISTIVVGFVLAFIFGAVANRFRLPPLVGYIVAGILVGPHSPGFVADVEIANELSEIGVILLMFGVGLNFSLKDLISVQAVAIPGALGRIVAGTLMGAGLGLALGWTIFASIIFGLALSIASTIVLLKTLQDRHLLDSERGRIAVGWVIVEDVATVLALVLIPAFAQLGGDNVVIVADPFVSFVERMLNTDVGLVGILAITVVKLAAFVGFMFIVGRRLIPMILHFTAHTGSRELFRLAVLAIALGVATLSAYLFGVSLALGAFFAGMILSESELSHRAAQETLPLRDAFAVLFFVAVGMLFDPAVIVTQPLPLLATVFIVLFGRTIVAFFLIIAFRRPAGLALGISANLAQIGEFSFILATLGISLGLLPTEARDLILAGAIISIVLNPAMVALADRLRPWVEARFPYAVPAGGDAAVGRIEPDLAEATTGAATAAEPHVAPEEEIEHATAQTGHTILAGYGRVGTVIGEGLIAAGIPFVLIEDAEGRVAAARGSGIEVIEGNAATPRALALANVKGAQTIIVAIPNAFEAGQATEQSRRLNPTIRIVARAHSDEEESHLTHLGADAVVMGEREIGLGMLSLLHNPDTDVIADQFKNDGVPIVTAVPNPLSPLHPSELPVAHSTQAPVEPASLASVEPDPPAASAPNPSDEPTSTLDDREPLGDDGDSWDELEDEEELASLRLLDDAKDAEDTEPEDKGPADSADPVDDVAADLPKPRPDAAQ